MNGTSAFTGEGLGGGAEGVGVDGTGPLAVEESLIETRDDMMIWHLEN